MDVLAFLVADYANISQDNKLNVMGIFGNIYAARFPAKHLSLTLVAKLSPGFGEYGQRGISIDLIDEDAKKIFSLKGNLEVPPPIEGKKPELNLIFDIQEIIFPRAGRYTFNLFVDKDLKANLPIDVQQIPENKAQELNDR